MIAYKLAYKKCEKASLSLYAELKDLLKEHSTLNEVFVLGEHAGGAGEGIFCFRGGITIHGFPEIREMSISYPPDLIYAYNYIQPDEHDGITPSIIETALIQNHDLCYDSSLGYGEGVRQFCSINVLVDEILRLTAKDFTPDKECEVSWLLSGK